VFIVAAFRLARRRNDLSAHLTAFFIIWYFVSISVSSSFITLPDIFVERRAYLPSIGLFAGITLQAQHIMAGKFSSRRVIGICTAVILLYTTAAIFRARLWRSDITIWKDVIASYPTNSRALNNLGNEYLKQERYDEAIPYLRKSLQLTIDDITYQNLGSALINTGKFAEAHRLYMEGLLHFPNDYLLLTGMGVCSYNTEDLKGALRYLKKAIAINGGHDLAEQYYKLTIEKLQRPQL
jgi:tetratricopeptide (TPR) repeat protein